MTHTNTEAVSDACAEIWNAMRSVGGPFWNELAERHRALAIECYKAGNLAALSRRAANSAGRVEDDATPFGHEYGEGPKLADMIAAMDAVEAEPVATGHSPELVAALNNLRSKLEALPEPLRGPFVVEGLKPYTHRSSSVSAEVTEFQQPVAGHWSSDEGTEMANRYLGMKREELGYGHLTDLELANAVYLASRNDLDLLAYQTAAKERIRWLSAQLAALNGGRENG